MARTKGAVDKAPRKKKETREGGLNGSEPAPMRRAATKLATGQQRAQSAARSDNGINDDLLEECVLLHEEQDGVLGSLRSDYMNRCKTPRQAQKDIAERARTGGIPVRAYKLELKRRHYEKQAMALREKAEPDDQELLDQIRRILKEKLGPYVDLPLGQAAMSDADRRARAVGSLAGGA